MDKAILLDKVKLFDHDDDFVEEFGRYGIGLAFEHNGKEGRVGVDFDGSLDTRAIKKAWKTLTKIIANLDNDTRVAWDPETLFDKEPIIKVDE